MKRRALFLAFVFPMLATRLPAAEVALPAHFFFQSGTLAPGILQVLPTTVFSAETGYGYEPGSPPTYYFRSVPGGDYPPVFFSVALPEGNYRVKAGLGGGMDAVTTVKAEQRRLMVEQVKSAVCQYAVRTFIVNVRTPRIAPGVEVKLKARERETETLQWDEKLTLEFGGRRPGLLMLDIEKAEVPTLFLLGDSTVCDQPGEPYASWGQMLPRFFKPEIAVANYAESGESLRSSFGARRLEKVASLLKAGDTVLIQFGHNDEKEKGEGVGAFTTYKASLRQYVAEVKKHGAQALLVTPVQRRTFEKDGTLRNSHGDYPEAVRQAAAEENVPFIDLHALSTKLYETLGPEKSGALFKPGDGTHHSNYGAYEVARCVVEGLRATHLPLVKSLAEDVPPFDPAHPDDAAAFSLPASPPPHAAETPLGN